MSDQGGGNDSQANLINRCEPPSALAGIRLLADSNLELDYIDHPIRHQPNTSLLPLS